LGEGGLLLRELRLGKPFLLRAHALRRIRIFTRLYAARNSDRIGNDLGANNQVTYDNPAVRDGLLAGLADNGKSARTMSASVR
jgi:hypothetical protein